MIKYLKKIILKLKFKKANKINRKIIYYKINISNKIYQIKSVSIVKSKYIIKIKLITEKKKCKKM